MRLSLSLLLTVGLAVFVATPAHAAGVLLRTDTTTLAEANADLDGATVQFSGEAVGEALRADSGHRWLSVLSDGWAIGVYAPTRQTEGIDGYGDWGMTGSTVSITGVYHVACDQHGGDLDVHSTQVRVVSGAVEREHPVHPAKALAAAVALATALALAARVRSSRRRTE